MLAADWIVTDDSDFRPVLEDNTFYVGSLINGTGNDNVVADIDYVSIGVIPEPRSIGLLLGTAGLLVRNRSRLLPPRRQDRPVVRS